MLDTTNVRPGRHVWNSAGTRDIPKPKAGSSVRTTKIAVIGLGYVGLPLAVELARHFPTTGFDIDAGRIAELRGGHDRTREVDPDDLRGGSLVLTSDVSGLAGHELYIVTVPTPVDARNQPDLRAVLAACRTVGTALRDSWGESRPDGGLPAPVVVFESTVYPGVTEDICGPALEESSGLVCGRDFFLGYSPERINPGDREHTISRITKVIAGQTEEVTERLAAVYGAVTTAGVYRATGIKVAEAAKVIENAQRDINIAFINEVSMIFGRLGISIHEVLEASSTKWNFLNFRPGMVGGHCIGVDPFYLAHLATSIGHRPEVILAGRRINETMPGYIADQIAERIAAAERPAVASRILVLGLTFKENVPDLRNSKVASLVNRLRDHGYRVDIHDPLADAAEAAELYGIALRPTLEAAEPYDCIIGAVPHTAYCTLPASTLTRLVRPGGLVADIKGMWRDLTLPDG
jgi:UDP-N-acetyl-D-glucosamine/UDP-N-acetyl-D-galactosamine dehydrogenase